VNTTDSNDSLNPPDDLWGDMGASDIAYEPPPLKHEAGHGQFVKKAAPHESSQDIETFHDVDDFEDSADGLDIDMPMSGDESGSSAEAMEMPRVVAVAPIPAKKMAAGGQSVLVHQAAMSELVQNDKGASEVKVEINTPIAPWKLRQMEQKPHQNEKILDDSDVKKAFDAEAACLGALIHLGEGFDEVSELIVADDFYVKDHAWVYQCIAQLSAKGELYDMISVSAELKKHPEIPKPRLDKLNTQYLSGLVAKASHPAGLMHYAHKVREAGRFRRLASEMKFLLEQVESPGARTSDQMLEEIERSISEINASVVASRNEPKLLRGLLVENLTDLEQKSEKNDPESVNGMTTGLTELDEQLDGMQRGDLIIVAARPSMGKTALTGNIAVNCAMQGHTVLMFSMEMPAKSISMRLLGSEGRIDLGRIRKGVVANEDWAKLTNGVAKLDGLNFYVDDSTAMSPAKIRGVTKRLIKKLGKPIDLIVVDYLQLMSTGKAGAARHEEVSTFSRELKQLAREINCPVVALSQLNRSLEQRPNKRPIMSDLKESGGIEQDADVIIFIYRDEVYNPDTQDRGMAELIISKQRNGPIGTVRSAFIGKYTRFEDYTGGGHDGGGNGHAYGGSRGNVGGGYEGFVDD
jgi:replicative DNA helicase